MHDALDFDCEACSLQLDAMHLLVVDSDYLVAKALVLSEVAQIANLEFRIHQLLSAKWRNRTEQAAKRAGAMAGQGDPAAAIDAEVARIMAKWVEDVTKPYTASITDLYKLARTAGWKKVTKQTTSSLQYTVGMLEKTDVKKAATSALLTPVFDLVDDSAISALHDDQMVWIGSHYNKNVRSLVKANTRFVISEGLGRRAAGRKMQKAVRAGLSSVHTPAGFRGSDQRYFEGLAANTATTGRVRGQMRSFLDAGATRYELVNPMDKRTGSICRHLNGKVFTVEDGTSQIESEAGATDPSQIRAAHPWKEFPDIKAISPKPGNVGVADSAKLAKEGFALPGYHFRCRTTVDVSVAAGSFKPVPIGTSGRKPVAPRPKPTKATVDAKPKTKPPAKKAPPSKRPATMPPAPRLASTEDWAESLSDTEKKSLNKWVGQGSSSIRSVQAGLKPGSAGDWDGHISNLEKAFSRAPLHKGVVYRGMANLDANFASKLKVGAVLDESAFTSYTTNKKTAALFATDEHDVRSNTFFATMEVKVAKAKGYSIDKAVTTGESEVVLDRPKLRIIEVKQVKEELEALDGQIKIAKGFHIVLEEV